MEGVVNDAAPSTIHKSNRELEHDILDVLCGKFMGLSPFEVLHTDLSDVLNLYVNCVIKDYKENNKTNNRGDEWVTSKNASWH